MVEGLNQPDLELTRTLVIVNDLGLHARAAAALVRAASRYRSDLTLYRGGREVDGKSIMGVLLLSATRGSRLVARARGADAEELLDELERLAADGFGEGR